MTLRSVRFLIYMLAFSPLLCLSACSEDEDPAPDNNGVSDNLHLAFKTPDWQRTIDCTHLDLNPYSVNDSVYAVSATSASTANTFRLSYPADSSDLVKPANLGKHSIGAYGESTTAAMQFALKLPVTEGGNYLLSKAGQSAEVYNEVVAITYVKTEGNEAVFRIKGKYSMVGEEINNTGNTRPISGTYHFQIKASRN